MGFGHISTKPVVEVEYELLSNRKKKQRLFALSLHLSSRKENRRLYTYLFLLAFRFLKTRDLGNERNSLSISCG